MNSNESVQLDVTTRILHLGLAIFGTWAWWLGDEAHDFHRVDHSGYTLHMYVGLTFAAFLAARLGYGFFGPRNQRFSTWVPYTRARFALVTNDLRSLARFRVPNPVSHQGLNAAVTSLALVLFTWQGLSGTLMSLLITPGQRSHGWLDAMQDVHSAAGVWIPVYLVLHVGAVILHALTKHQIWKKMLFLG
ncbi:MAG TPA: cytochrome b/b6 domain-containing protein [Gammaproteobacteria bacterium]